MKKLLWLSCLCAFVVGFVAFVWTADLGNRKDRQSGRAGVIQDLGMPQVREVEDRSGNRIRITVTPSRNARVNPKIFEGWEIVRASVDPHSKVTAVGDKGSVVEERIDVTGYQIQIEPVNMIQAAATCSSVFKAYKAAPFSLAGGGVFSVRSTSPESMDVNAYPTLGDVDTFIYLGSSLCASSIKGPLHLDSVGCFSTICKNTLTLKGQIRNVSAISTAKFVGEISAFFITF